MLKPEQIALLGEKLNPANVKRNPRGFDYVESWRAEAEANRIFGFDGWSSTILDARMVVERETTISKGKPYEKPGWTVSYVATVRVEAGGVIRDGVGAGQGIDVDLGLAHESALKESASDAEKRALKTFGNVFGLALYDKERTNVGVDAPAQTSGRKSSAQAKRDGNDIDIKAKVSSADLAGLLELEATFDDWTATYPLGWLDAIQNQILLRREELMSPAVEMADAEFDEAFKATVGPRAA